MEAQAWKSRKETRATEPHGMEKVVQASGVSPLMRDSILEGRFRNPGSAVNSASEASSLPTTSVSRL